MYKHKAVANLVRLIYHYIRYNGMIEVFMLNVSIEYANCRYSCLTHSFLLNIAHLHLLTPRARGGMFAEVIKGYLTSKIQRQ